MKKSNKGQPPEGVTSKRVSKPMVLLEFLMRLFKNKSSLIKKEPNIKDERSKMYYIVGLILDLSTAIQITIPPEKLEGREEGIKWAEDKGILSNNFRSSGKRIVRAKEKCSEVANKLKGGRRGLKKFAKASHTDLIKLNLSSPSMDKIVKELKNLTK